MARKKRRGRGEGIFVRLQPELLKLLETYCEKTGVTRQEVVRTALTEFFERKMSGGILE